jgi:hypothetical protein
MPFVKLDCTLLDSTLWVDRPAREIFLTALLMGEPYELEEDTPEIQTRSLENTDFVVPAGKYGFVRAAGIGIGRRAMLDDKEEVLSALERLASTEADSRSSEFGGRRMVRINGGFIILNWEKYRRKDHTAAERQRRHRERNPKPKPQKSHAVTSQSNAVTSRDVTEEEGEGRGERGEGRISTTPEKKKEVRPDIDRYYIACTIALNHGMQENSTVEGEWMPVTASSQVARVTWCEDGIPLGIVEEIVLERSKAYRCSGTHRGPRSLKYFDLAVRETWERGQQSVSDAKVSEVLSR